MPQIKENTELNFIWFGGNMPDDQMDNLIDIMVHNREVLVQLWVDSDDTYKKLSVQIAKSIKRYDLEKNEKYSNLKPLNISYLKNIPEVLLPYIDQIKKERLYPALSDIYRLLILSRPREKNGRSIRCYFEADNKLEDYLWQHLENKEVAVIYVDEFKGEVQFPPEAIRTDFILLDLNAPLGEKLQQNMRKHLATIFSDPVLSACFAELNAHLGNKHSLAQFDLIDTYGWLVLAIFWMEFLTDTPENVYGLQDILISRERSNKAVKFGHFGKLEDHWSKKGKDTPLLCDGLVRDVFRAVLSDSVDKSRKILRSVLNELGANAAVNGRRQYFATLQDFLAYAITSLMCKTGEKDLVILKRAIDAKFAAITSKDINRLTLMS